MQGDSNPPNTKAANRKSCYKTQAKEKYIEKKIIKKKPTEQQLQQRTGQTKIGGGASSRSLEDMRQRLRTTWRHVVAVTGRWWQQWKAGRLKNSMVWRVSVMEERRTIDLASLKLNDQI
jgi:hypothetical protein